MRIKQRLIRDYVILIVSDFKTLIVILTIKKRRVCAQLRQANVVDQRLASFTILEWKKV